MAEPPRHFYVSPKQADAYRRGTTRFGACAKKGCGLPPAHPIHLKHPISVPEREAATG